MLKLSYNSVKYKNTFKNNMTYSICMNTFFQNMTDRRANTLILDVIVNVIKNYVSEERVQIKVQFSIRVMYLPVYCGHKTGLVKPHIWNISNISAIWIVPTSHMMCVIERLAQQNPRVAFSALRLCG